MIEAKTLHPGYSRARISFGWEPGARLCCSIIAEGIFQPFLDLREHTVKIS